MNSLNFFSFQTFSWTPPSTPISVLVLQPTAGGLDSLTMPSCVAQTAPLQLRYLSNCSHWRQMCACVCVSGRPVLWMRRVFDSVRNNQTGWKQHRPLLSVFICIWLSLWCVCVCLTLFLFLLLFFGAAHKSLNLLKCCWPSIKPKYLSRYQTLNVVWTKNYKTNRGWRWR